MDGKGTHAEIEENETPEPEVANKNESTLITCSPSPPPPPTTSSSYVPEYKQILQNLFNMFKNSKRKYPIPMYPYVNNGQ